MITAQPIHQQVPAVVGERSDGSIDVVWQTVDDLERIGRNLSQVGLDEFKALLSEKLALRAQRAAVSRKCLVNC